MMHLLTLMSREVKTFHLRLIAARISRTAVSNPTKIARAMMLWPMLNSVISKSAHRADVSISQSVTGRDVQPILASPVPRPLLNDAIRAPRAPPFAVNTARAECRFRVSRRT